MLFGLIPATYAQNGWVIISSFPLWSFEEELQTAKS